MTNPTTPNPPPGYRLATEQERECVPQNAKIYYDDGKWYPTAYARRKGTGVFYAVPDAAPPVTDNYTGCAPACDEGQCDRKCAGMAEPRVWVKASERMPDKWPVWVWGERYSRPFLGGGSYAIDNDNYWQECDLPEPPKVELSREEKDDAFAQKLNAKYYTTSGYYVTDAIREAIAYARSEGGPK